MAMRQRKFIRVADIHMPSGKTMKITGPESGSGSGSRYKCMGILETDGTKHNRMKRKEKIKRKKKQRTFVGIEKDIGFKVECQKHNFTNNLTSNLQWFEEDRGSDNGQQVKKASICTWSSSSMSCH